MMKMQLVGNSDATESSSTANSSSDFQMRVSSLFCQTALLTAKRDLQKIMCHATIIDNLLSAMFFVHIDSYMTIKILIINLRIMGDLLMHFLRIIKD